MSALPDTVTVRVPGSTSNCGAGFDTLGLALGIYNRITLTRASGGRPEPERPADGRGEALVTETARRYYAFGAVKPTGFRYRIEGEVPPARGLGSSVTVIAGVLAGLDALHGTGFTRYRLVEITTAVEGHPDNASAGVLGGFTVSRCDPATGAWVDTLRFPVPPGLVFALASPEIELLTKDSRGALPATLPYFDAVKSINSAAYLVAAFASGAYSKLAHAGGDFMHEPYRLPKIPGAAAAIKAGVAAGAFTGWLSGSGSSVLCVCAKAVGAQVAPAMAAAFAAAGVQATARVLEADNHGLQVEA